MRPVTIFSQLLVGRSLQDEGQVDKVRAVKDLSKSLLSNLALANVSMSVPVEEKFETSQDQAKPRGVTCDSLLGQRCH